MANPIIYDRHRIDHIAIALAIHAKDARYGGVYSKESEESPVAFAFRCRQAFIERDCRVKLFGQLGSETCIVDTRDGRQITSSGEDAVEAMLLAFEDALGLSKRKCSHLEY